MNTDPGNATIASPSFAGGCSAPQVPSRMKAICKGSSQNTTDLLAGSMSRERLQRTSLSPILGCNYLQCGGLLQPHMKSLPHPASPTPKSGPTAHLAVHHSAVLPHHKVHVGRAHHGGHNGHRHALEAACRQVGRGRQTKLLSVASSEAPLHAGRPALRCAPLPSHFPPLYCCKRAHSASLSLCAAPSAPVMVRKPRLLS